jgi:transposase
MRYELTDGEWTAIKSMLPNKPRGVPRVNDRRVLKGILWVLRSGAPWRDLPDSFGPYTTCYNRFVRWRRAGVWAGIMNALAAALGERKWLSPPPTSLPRAEPTRPMFDPLCKLRPRHGSPPSSNGRGLFLW